MSDMATEKKVSFYDDLWSNRPKVINLHEAQRLAKIFSAMVTVKQRVEKPVPTICDLGCGIGWLANELRVFGDVTGVDSSPEGVRIAEHRWHGINFETANILNYRPDNAFDVVISSEVIEHIEDKESFMDTVTFLLRDGGFFIITCPNGSVKKYHDNLNAPQQPIEQWPTYNELRALIGKYMKIEYPKTFLFDFSEEGMLRILNSYKLNKLLKHVGLERAFQLLCCFSKFGLYQIILASKH